TRNTPSYSVQLEGSNQQLANLCGPLDENLRQIADGWNVSLNRRGNNVTLTGDNAETAGKAVEWFHLRAKKGPLSIDDVQLGLVELGASRVSQEHDGDPDPTLAARALPEVPPVDDMRLTLRTRRTDLRPRTPRQRDYLNQILKHDITFGVGPAGTGKTWLAVACA